MSTNNQNNPDLFVQGLKNIAKSSLENDETLLEIWWSNKYKLPRSHPLFLKMHLEEILIEYFQDQINSKDSNSELPQEMIDEDEKWQGETSEEHEEKIKKRLSKEPKVDLSKYQTEESFQEIDEVFE